jgi:hypothetical protein
LDFSHEQTNYEQNKVDSRNKPGVAHLHITNNEELMINMPKPVFIFAGK